MHIYKIEVIETSSRIIEVEAVSRESAMNIVEDMHKTEEITLTASDFDGVEFNEVKDDSYDRVSQREPSEEDHKDKMVEEGFCPHCDVELVSKMFDVDGTNLEEHQVCPACGYGSPALH